MKYQSSYALGHGGRKTMFVPRIGGYIDRKLTITATETLPFNTDWWAQISYNEVNIIA